MNEARALIEDFEGRGEMIPIPETAEYATDHLYVCKHSGLVRAKTTRTSKEIADAWSTEVYSDNFESNTYTAKVPAVVARQTYVAETAIANLDLSEARICEIGAGEGQFFKILGQLTQGSEFYGIEPSSKNCKMLKSEGVDAFNGTVEEFADSPEFREDYFDVIFIMWTLVNSFSCFRMVEIAHKMLREGGTLVVAEGSRLLVPFKKPLHMYLNKDLAVDLHPFHFSANSLENLLKVNAFSTTFVNRYMDHDVLCVMGRKGGDAIMSSFVVDDYEKILDFFSRWHNETQFYK